MGRLRRSNPARPAQHSLYLIYSWKVQL